MASAKDAVPQRPLQEIPQNSSLQGHSSGISPVKPSQNISNISLIHIEHQNGAHDDLLANQKYGIVKADATASYSYSIVCPKSIALLLGRAKPCDLEEDTFQDTGKDSIGGSVPLKRVALPIMAHHVSRDHAIIYHTPFGGTWAIKILGQNGLIVNGKRRRAGHTLRLIEGETILDFFGVSCLFEGDSKQEVDFDSAKVSIPLHDAHANQDGRSPTKKIHPTLVPAPNDDDYAIQIKSLKSTKFIGNTQKRPLGAPYSPPTSSPVAFEAPSSPGNVHRVVQEDPSSLNSDDNSEDEMNGGRISSPTLARRNGHKNHEAQLLLPGERGSEDEASQALIVSHPHKPALPSSTKREVPGDEEEAEQSPRATPRPVGQKRVKFHQSTTPQASSNRTPSSTMALPNMQAIQSHYRSLVSQLADTYDLQGLLAGIIVFHRTATISATEAVRSVLAANPGLMKGEIGPEGKIDAPQGSVIPGWTVEQLIAQELATSREADAERVEIWQRKAWREKLEECLMEGDCFGIIQRAGKDASGNPLECWYYYDKEHDHGKSMNYCKD